MAQLARKHGKPSATFCGLLESRELESEFGLICKIRDPDLSIDENMQQGAIRLRSAAAGFVHSLLSAAS